MPALLPLDTLSFDLSHSSLLTHDLRTRTRLVGTTHVYNSRFSSLQMYHHLFVHCHRSLSCASPYISLLFSSLFSPRCSRPDVALDPWDLWSHHPRPHPTLTSVLSPTSFPRHCVILVSCPPSSRRHPQSSFFVRTFHPRRLWLSFTFANLHLPLVIPFSHGKYHLPLKS